MVPNHPKTTMATNLGLHRGSLRCGGTVFVRVYVHYSSSRDSLIMPENPTQSCRAGDRSIGRGVCGVNCGRIDNGTTQPLVRSFGVIMRKVFMNGVAQSDLAEGDDAAQTFLFEGAEEALHDGIAIGRLRWGSDRAYASVGQDAAEAFAERAIQVHEAETALGQEAIEAIGQVSRHLRHPVTGGMGGDADQVDTTGVVMNGEQSVARTYSKPLNSLSVTKASARLHFYECPEEISACHCDDRLDQSCRHRHHRQPPA